MNSTVGLQGNSKHPSNLGKTMSRSELSINKVGLNYLGASVVETAKLTTNLTASVRQKAAQTMRKGILKSVSSRSKKRNGWGLEWMIGSQLGQFTFLFFTAISLVIVASIAWDAFGQDSESDDAVIDSNRRWRSALWFSWALFFDPGTQTGLSGYSQTQVLACAGIISSFGFIFNLVMLGFMVDQIRSFLHEGKLIYGKDVVNDHVLILGWTEKTTSLIEALMIELTDESKWWSWNKPTIVVMGPESRVAMIQTCRLAISKKVQKHSNVRLVFREGNPHEIEDLVKVSVKYAKVAIVLGNSRDPELADCKVTSAVLAVKSLKQSPPVISELRLLESVGIIKQLGGSSVIGVAPTPLMDSLMVISTLQPAAGLVLADLLSFQNTSGFLIKPQPFSANQHHATGHTSKITPLGFKILTYGETRKLMRGSVVMGVVPVRGDIMLAPPDHFVLASTDMLLVITKSKTMEKVSGFAQRIHERLTSNGSDDNDVEKGSGITMSEVQDFPSSDDSTHVLSLRSPVMEDGSSWRAPVWKEGGKQVVIVLGWRTGVGMAVLLKSFDERLNNGSELHIVSYHTESDRNKDMEGCFKARRIKLVHHVGEITRESVLKKLPLSRACSVLVLRDVPPIVSTLEHKYDPHTSDSRALIAAVVIADLMKQEFNGSKCPIAVQFLDTLAQRILTEQPHLFAKLNTLVPIHRNALETGVLALAATEPKLVGFFERLLFPDTDDDKAPDFISAFSPFKLMKSVKNNSPSLREQSLNDSMEASFWDLDALVRESGMLLIGWHREGYIHHTLNPSNKHEKLHWTERDLLLVAYDPINNTSINKNLGGLMKLAEESSQGGKGELELKVGDARSAFKARSRKYMSFSEPLDGQLDDESMEE